MLTPTLKDAVPTTQISNVIYEYTCRCDARYVGRTSQRLVDRIKQHVPSTIRNKNASTRTQPKRDCKSTKSVKQCDSAIGLHLLNNKECADSYSDKNFEIIGRARSSFHLGTLEAVYIKTKQPFLCRQKEFVYSLRLLSIT